MNEAPLPNILPQSQNPPVYGPIYSTGKTHIKRPSIPPIAVILGVLVILIVGSLVFAANRPKKSTVIPTPTPTVTPSPTPIQTLTPFATQSAFVAFDQSVDTFPATVSGATVSDATLSPPSVDLNLGFQK